MSSLAIQTSSVPFRPAGYRIAYHRNTTNHCPGCGNTHWILGRSSAQCATCDTAVPFATPFRFAA